VIQKLTKVPDDFDGDDFEPGWWFKDPNYGYVGPYDTKDAAQEDKKGLDLFYKDLAKYKKREK